MKSFRSSFPRLALAGVFGATLALCALARDMRYATGYPPNSIGSIAADRYAEALAEYSDGEHSAKAYPLTLLNFMEMSDGLRDGMAFSGAQWSRWAEAMEVSPVSMSVNEMYEGISQGVIDCTIQSTPELTIFKMMEVVTGITVSVPGGVYGTSSNSINADYWKSIDSKGREAVMYAQASLENMETARELDRVTVHEPGGIFGGIGTHVNSDTWNSLSEQTRSAVMYGSAAIAAELAVLYVEDHETNRQLIEDKADITVYQAGDEFRDQTRAFIEKDLNTIADRYQERYDLERSATMISEFRELLEKVKDVHTREELMELYWNDVFSTVESARTASESPTGSRLRGLAPRA